MANLIAYPFDAELSADGTYDRTISATDERYFNNLRYLSGIFDGSGEDPLKVSAAEGLSLSIGIGACNLNGVIAYQKEEQTITLSPADAEFSRIDRIVMRLDNGTRSVYPAVISSEGKKYPDPPEIKRNARYWDLALADVLISPEATSIAEESITDLRGDTSLSGYVAAAVPIRFDEEVEKQVRELRTYVKDTTGDIVKNFGGEIKMRSTLTYTFDEDFRGASCTITGGGLNETFIVPDRLSYSVECKELNCEVTAASSANDANYSVVLPVGTYYGFYTARLRAFTATIDVLAIEGAMDLAENDEPYFYATGDASGHATLIIKNEGTYQVQATKGDQASWVKTIAVTENDGKYTLDCRFVQIYGVKWNYGASSSALTRLTTKNDTVVNTDITEAPSPATAKGAGSSPFDTLLPWSEMEEYNIVNNQILYKRGDDGFSRTAYDTVVKIPEFYYKIVDDAKNSLRYYYIADRATEGFEKHPGSNRYVGRYKSSGKTPIYRDSMTFNSALAAFHKKGDHWWSYDYLTYCAIALLYLVEYADFNSQKVIGAGLGHTNEVYDLNNGQTDAMIYHTGKLQTNSNYGYCVQYRHIESLWGDGHDYIAGALYYYSNGTFSICTNPSDYGNTSKFTKIATDAATATGSYVTKLGYVEAAPWAIYPKTCGGSSSTYVCDEMYGYNSGPYLGIGDLWNSMSGDPIGLFCFRPTNDTSGYCYREIFIPGEENAS